MGSTETRFLMTPNFNFADDAHTSRLVDYSFTDDSDNDYENDSRAPHFKEPLQKLKSELALLTSRARQVQCDRRRRDVQRRFSRHLKERASLRLKTEEDDEKLRNECVLKRLNDALSLPKTHCGIQGRLCTPQEKQRSRKMKSTQSSSLTVYDTERPTKKHKMDLNIFRRCSKKPVVKKVACKRKQMSSWVVDDDDTVPTDCLFGFLKMKR